MPNNETIERDEENEELDGEDEIAQTTPSRGRSTAARKKPPAPNPGVGGNAGNMLGRARTKEDGTPNSKWQSHEAELLWPEIISYLEGVGKSPYDVSVQIARVNPPGPDGAMPLGAIDGQALVGDAQVSAGDKLMQIITDTKHMPTARGPARYEARFTWKVGSGRIGTGILNLPSPAEIMALRNAAMQQQYESERQQPPPGVGTPPRHPQAPPQAPQQPWPQQPPPWQQPHPYSPYGYAPPPPWGYGAPPQNPGLSPEMAALQSQLERTQGALNEALAAAREGRQPRIEGVAAAPINEDMIVAKVLTALRAAGIGVQPAAPPQVAAPPVAASDVTTRGRIEKMVDGIMETAIGVFGQNLQKSVRQVMGVGGIPEEAAAVVEPVPTPEVYEAPFDVAPVADAKWPNGDPVRYAADRETGNISPMGLAMSNPYVADKIVGIANGLTEGLTEALKGLVKGQAQTQMREPPAQVVREIPRGAQDASEPPNGQGNPEGGGWPQV
jgi:hypothetical protein